MPGTPPHTPLPTGQSGERASPTVRPTPPMTDPRHLDASTSDAQPHPVVRISSVEKRYGEHGPIAVRSFDLEVRSGEILCLLGPSGCGKTTLLRLIAGFEAPDQGRVEVGGRVVAGDGVWVQPERRRIGFVFQDFALFPHMSVLDNVAFGLPGRSRAERRARAAKVLALVGLTVFQQRYPHQLSGGQQQRVALARAIATEPHLLLLDEPFSNLDAALRGATRDEVRSILKRTGTTAVMVTHDQEEALSVADRVAVMRAGHLEQLGTPEEVYLEPRTAFVAGFLGRTNLLRGTANGDHADTALGPVTLARPATGRVVLSVRPEHVAFERHPADGATPGVRLEVLRREFKGHDVTYECRPLRAAATGQASANEAQADERILVNATADCLVREGDVASVRVTGQAVPLEPSPRTPD
ncbi:MAG: ABC transporter ATP-binding protein [Trueperaceae bacterium]